MQDMQNSTAVKDTEQMKVDTGHKSIMQADAVLTMMPVT